MYSLLIVDDEQIEREGIKFLLNKYKLDLKVYEADNGEKALELIKSNHIDILLTDIKMPFMDGLDLSYHAKKNNPSINVIIFSAYGEFDYAKKAIDNSVQNYLLKPIDPEEFFNVMSRTIAVCAEYEEKAINAEKLMEGYNKGLAYEKEKLILDILNGAAAEEKNLQRLNEINVNLIEEQSIMLFIDFKEKFFDTKNDDFADYIKRTVSYGFEYLNLNEYQSIIFLKNLDTEADEQALKQIGAQVVEGIGSDIKACLIFSNTVHEFRNFNEEYRKIEQLLDYSFFFDESVILFADRDFPHSSVAADKIDSIVDEIHTAFDSGDNVYLSKSLDHLFNAFKADGSYSPVYVKYVCADILKKKLKKNDKMDEHAFKSSLDKIFDENNMVDLHRNMLSLIAAPASSEQENSDIALKKVIKNVLEIIDNDYMKDISLEYIANKVYLTPTYLSYLFKKETGQSIIKYITLFRLNKARELLQDTNMRIIDICEKVGYEKLSYFCAIFKNNFGITPAKYRERGEAK